MSVGCKNPILIASHLMKKCMLPHDDVNPLEPACFLVAEGARAFADTQNEVALQASLVSTQSLDCYKKMKSQLDSPLLPQSLDTVGGLAVAGEEAFAACSSGGIIMKKLGRLGSAAVPGAGCASRAIKDGLVSCCATGIANGGLALPGFVLQLLLCI